MDVLLVGVTKFVCHLFFHFLAARKQHQHKDPVHHRSHQPPQPNEDQIFSSEGVEAVEGELENGEAELSECVHDEAVVIPLHRLHVQHKMQLCDIVDHVETEENDENMAE